MAVPSGLRASTAAHRSRRSGALLLPLRVSPTSETRREEMASAIAAGQDPQTWDGHPARVRALRRVIPQDPPFDPLLAAQSPRVAVPVPGPVRASSSSPGPVAAPAAIPGAGLFRLLRLSLLSTGLLLLLPVLPARAAAPPAAPPAKRPASALQAAVEPREKTDAEKQKQTVADMRNLGTALFSWLTDQVGAAAAGQQTRGVPEETEAQKTVDVQNYPPISMAELEALLVPEYIQKIPETDGWGNPYEVRLNVDDVLAKHVISIRSPGRDGVYSSDVYTINGYDPKDYDQDVVWADGFFVRWPQKTN